MPVRQLAGDPPTCLPRVRSQAIKIDGTVADMSIAIGVDACATLVGFKTCGSDLTSSLPIYILKNTLHFQGLCGGGSYSTYSEQTYDTYDTDSAPT